MMTLTALAVALAVACGASSGTPQPTPTAPPTPTTIATPAGGPGVEVGEEIFDFKLRSLTIAPGTTVRWVNRDPFPHTVTSGTPEVPVDTWDSGQLGTGEGFERAFEQAGTFPFYCTIHPYMKATLTVARP
jgi:plastocyanin